MSLQPRPDGFNDMLAVLKPQAGLRVWSVLVTIFGDLAQDKDARLSSGALAALTQPLDIRPEALRVALHRLRKDNWLVSERMGRSSNYGLSPQALNESHTAAPRIYDPAPAARDYWKLVVLPVSQKTLQTNGLELVPGVFLLGDEDLPEDTFAMSGQINTLPEWLMMKVASPELVHGFQTLDQKMAIILRVLRRQPNLDARQRAIIRVVIVHEWRRLVLKLPEVADSLLPHTWPGRACRQRVLEALALLPRPEIVELLNVAE